MNRTLSPATFIISMIFLLMVPLGATFYLYLSINDLPYEKLDVLTVPVTQEPVSLTLNLSSPDDNVFTTSSDLLVQGKTSPKAEIILSTEAEDFVLETSSSGSFSTTIRLTEGVNSIEVSAFDDLGNNKDEQRTVYYSKEKI